MSKISALSSKHLFLPLRQSCEAGLVTKAAFGVLEQRKQQQTPTRKKALLEELKICGRERNLKRGKELHVDAMESGNDSCIYVATALVNMYAKCRSMLDARRVFDAIKFPNSVSWTTLILGYAETGKGVIALDLFARMQSHGCEPNSFTIVAALKACVSLALNQGKRAEGLERGKEIHARMRPQIPSADLYVQNTLIDMYSKCGSMADARRVFDALRLPDVVSWNALILGYAENGEGSEALDMFARMESQGCPPNSVTFIAALKACASFSTRPELCLQRGRQIHSKMGMQSDVYVQNTLVDMYAKCGSLREAHQAFDGIKHPDVVSWTALILGYAETGEGRAALDLFARMKSERCAPNAVTFIAALKACSSLSSNKAECLRSGRQVHVELGQRSDIYVQNTLIDMYAKNGSMIDAHRVFDSIKHPTAVSWAALILGYAENGEAATALDLFASMRSQGCAPDAFTYLAALKACSLLGALDFGSKLHAELSSRAELDAISVTSLVDFYAKCGCMVEAQNVFDSQPRRRNLITWNTLLAGYSRLGDVKVVVSLFQEMQDAGFRPDAVTFLSTLTCCSHAGLVEEASMLFEQMSGVYGIAPAAEHYICMVDILGRSNQLDRAVALLQSMPCRPDAVSWMTLLAACRKWKNVEIGRLAFKSLLNLDDTIAAAYVVMAHTYASRGMWEEQATVLALRKRFRSWKAPGQSCWTTSLGQVHTFSIT